ncbi:MAG TPA: TolC family protein [Vicinamibacterales bacterium]|jgi:outer membrane protein
MIAKTPTVTAALFLLLAVRATAQAPAPLTLEEAERRALQNHPQLQATQFASAAAREVVRETRSAYFPTVVGSVTGAEALDGSRIAAGALNNPIIYDRFATGVSVGQLVTDFGRTRAVVRSSSLNADARAQDVDDERAFVLLEVDRAYFSVLRAQAVERVSQATVDARRLVLDQVTALAQSNLRSGLDVSFATVNLSAAQLQLVQAQNETQRAFATLAVALGESSVSQYAVADQPLPTQPSSDSAPLVADALRQRPDVLSARLTAESSSAFAEAEGDLWRPSVAAVGAAGVTPYHQTGIEDRYAAAAVNVNVPILNGSLYSARHAEASLRARAISERLRDLENRVRRDVQVAWLDARTAFQRLDLTRQLSEQAAGALDLAQSRYDLGLGSIVELSQAQLNKTQADLEGASATYDYQVDMAVLAHATGARK